MPSEGKKCPQCGKKMTPCWTTERDCWGHDVVVDSKVREYCPDCTYAKVCGHEEKVR